MSDRLPEQYRRVKTPTGVAPKDYPTSIMVECVICGVQVVTDPHLISRFHSLLFPHNCPRCERESYLIERL
jgi:hypothetical protein